MKACIISILAVGALAQSSTSTSSTMSMSTNTSSSPEYSITAVPSVISIQSSIPCIYNCLIPIGLADPSGCDEVNNDCACLSAPAGAQQAITDCINTVCQSSTSLYASMATSLYQSYCNAAYPAALLSSATSSESVSDAQAASSSTMTSNSTTTSVKPSANASPSATSKSEAGVWQPSLCRASVGVIFGLLLLGIL